MTPFEIRNLYKKETGCSVEEDCESEIEFEIWRSKGQQIINISDEQKFNLFGNYSEISIPKMGNDYITWLEEKVMEMINNNSLIS